MILFHDIRVRYTEVWSSELIFTSFCIGKCFKLSSTISIVKNRHNCTRICVASENPLATTLSMNFTHCYIIYSTKWKMYLLNTCDDQNTDLTQQARIIWFRQLILSLILDNPIVNPGLKNFLFILYLFVTCIPLLTVYL